MRLLPRRKYVSGNRWTLWRWTDVDPEEDGEVYLTRLHLFQTPLCSCMLHWIRRADPQPDLHDHPNSFLSVLLSGSYVEEVPSVGGGVRLRKILWWNWKSKTDRHRILSLQGSVLTLVFAGRVTREWGFHTERGWQPWREYVSGRRKRLGMKEETSKSKS